MFQNQLGLHMEGNLHLKIDWRCLAWLVDLCTLRYIV